MHHVERISLYPIKSLDPVRVTAATVLPSGALQHDREFALFDDQGKVINGKRDARIHQIRAKYDLSKQLVTLFSGTYHLIEQQREIESSLGEFLGLRVSLRRNEQTGFPDDLDSPGPTVVSTASLREIASWFGITSSDDIARRFRANVEVAAAEPFWEDRLFGDAGTVAFRIGDVRVHGVNPCQRCAVPSRDPESGAVRDDFQRLFAEKRQATLPAWATRSRFNHFYRLSVNTRIPASEAGKVISEGDKIHL